MPDDKKPAGKRYRLENRDPHRSRWVFELLDENGVLSEIVLGDPADRSIPDNKRTKLTSSPEVVISEDQIARMTPASRRTLAKLIETGAIEQRPL